MRTILSWFSRAVAFLTLVLVPALASAQVIDFETLPMGGGTVDQQTISTEYQSLGVTFTLLDPVTGAPIGSPRIAKVGLPATAFGGCMADDTPFPYLGLGESFLTDGTAIALEGHIAIEYDPPVAQTSGVVLDVDCRTNGGPPCEQWTITAYDSLGVVLDSLVVDAPQGPGNPECRYPEQGPGDSAALAWAFSVGTADIKTIIFRYTGTAPTVGLAFDNLRVSSLPSPLNVSAVAAADTICAGEPVTLSAFPTGGYPPYSMQWQQEAGPGSWVDLGTGGTQDVQPGSTTNYRVTVTDTHLDEATSEVEVAVVTGGSLCSATLIVSSNANDSVVRYSFRSQLAQVMVPSGSGGLNSTSKLVIGPDGNLYVASQANDRVLRYDGTTGAFIDVFVTAGSGGLDIPVGLDFGPDGNLYVASNLSAVRRYDGTTGAYIDAFIPNGLNHPTGLVFGPDDNLYVCSRDDDKVFRFDGTTGAFIDNFVPTGSGGLDAPRGLVFGPDGNLYIGEETNDSVRRYDGTTGAFIDVFVPSGSGGLDRANDVVFGPDGILYVASFNSDQLLGYDGTTGAFLGALPSELLSHPAWFAVGGPRPVTAVHSGTPPSPLSVEPNIPNPFNPTTTVRFTLPVAGPARVTVFDVTGRLVATLLDRPMSAGRHAVEWNADDTASGVYFVRVESRGKSATRKMTLLK